MSLGDVSAGTHALDLSQFGFAPGNYMLYVKAVAKPSMQKVSFPVSFNPGGPAAGRVALGFSEPWCGAATGDRLD